MIKYQHKKEIAEQFVVNIDGDVQQYALSLLHIINNARVNPTVFYKVENTDGNHVYVTFNSKYRDSVKEYLSSFGEIVMRKDINWFTISAKYDEKGWDEFFGNDCDADFVVEID